MNKEIKDKIEELFNNTPEGVGVGWGKKMKNGIPTGEQSIVFTVEKKKPLDELKEEEILPSSIEIGGEKVKTDVIQIGKVKLLACDAPTLAACYDWWDGWDAIHIDNWDEHRPLVGGIQMTSDAKIGYVGTLGAIVVDTETDALVGLTNNHVVVGNAFYTSVRPINTTENESDDVAYQEYVDVDTSIGKVLRYVPLTNGWNQVDGAIVSVDPSVIDIAESFKQYGLSYALPMEFASTAEIDDLTTTDPPLCSSGRTTGAKEGDPCGLIIQIVDYVDGLSGYWNGYVETTASFNGLLVFSRINTDCPYPTYSGDSGSVLIANFSGTWKIVGLVFAGSDYYGLACRIDEVASQLGIEAWDGSVKPYIDLTSQEILTVSGTSSSKTITCDGKTYWQIGAGMVSNPCVT